LLHYPVWTVEPSSVVQGLFETSQLIPIVTVTFFSVYVIANILGSAQAAIDGVLDILFFPRDPFLFFA
jgi:hypothetical protein